MFVLVILYWIQLTFGFKFLGIWQMVDIEGFGVVFCPLPRRSLGYWVSTSFIEPNWEQKSIHPCWRAVVHI